MPKLNAQVTTDPIRPAPEAVLAAHPKPEWLRIPQVEQRYGIKRGTVYNMVADGLIKSVCLRVRGKRQGCRLISTDSIDQFIARMMTEQGGVSNEA